MSESEQRVGRNEAMFRQINERIEDLNDAFAEVSGTMEIVCECEDMGCVEQIILLVGDYENVRADSALFIVVTGHEGSAATETVERREEGYSVVRKHGEALTTATETDPRP